uniref:Transposase n=1 Tax=Steinernema glaseri TaxID=37863 RepID=A0A1I7Y582_9BILA
MRVSRQRDTNITKRSGHKQGSVLVKRGLARINDGYRPADSGSEKALCRPTSDYSFWKCSERRQNTAALRQTFTHK